MCFVLIFTVHQEYFYHLLPLAPPLASQLLSSGHQQMAETGRSCAAITFCKELSCYESQGDAQGNQIWEIEAHGGWSCSSLHEGFAKQGLLLLVVAVIPNHTGKNMWYHCDCFNSRLDNYSTILQKTTVSLSLDHLGSGKWLFLADSRCPLRSTGSLHEHDFLPGKDGNPSQNHSNYQLLATQRIVLVLPSTTGHVLICTDPFPLRDQKD